MKLNRNLIIILTLATFISSCGSVKESLSLKKKDNYDEFSVRNKDPLILPPNFDDLPVPQEESIKKEDESENVDLSGVLKSSKAEKKITETKKGSLERSISKILNSN
jgi:hypothetical protein